MKTISLVLAVALVTPLGGCFFRTSRRNDGPAYRESRSCPPAHHWEGGVCVHNGHGPKTRDHR